MPHRIFLFLLATFALVATRCPKGADNNDMTDGEDPDTLTLCEPEFFCPDGRHPELMRTWEPVGGVFKGNSLTQDCIDGLCPDMAIAFFSDSTYRIDYVELGLDSSGKVFPVSYTEKGRWRAFDCECRDIEIKFTPYAEQNGKILLSPDNDAPYTVKYNGFYPFQGYNRRLFLNGSSRDSTLDLFFQAD